MTNRQKKGIWNL